MAFYYLVPSSQPNSDELFRVSLDVYKGNFCTCPAYRFGAKAHLNFDCKHIFAAREFFNYGNVHFWGPTAVSESPLHPVRLEARMWADPELVETVQKNQRQQKAQWTTPAVDAPLYSDQVAELVDIMGVDL